jgi:putative nucleotidyltransferase with HDIG domain
MTANQMLAQVHDLPPISPAALELGGLLGRSVASNKDVIRVLQQDPVLTAKLLRVCNSAALGLKEAVGSIDHAVLILGHGRVSQMVQALSFRGSLTAPLTAYSLDANELWRHSLLTATVAEIAVADGLSIAVDPATAFTVGLLHDIGKLITNQFLTGELVAPFRRCRNSGSSLVEAEREVLGTDHAEVGGGLAYLWRLPDPIVEGIALHHRPVLAPEPRLSALVNFAHTVAFHAEAAEAGRDYPLSRSEVVVFHSLGFSVTQFECLVRRARECSAATDESLLAAA